MGGQPAEPRLPDTSPLPRDSLRAPARPTDAAELTRLRRELAQERGECAALHAALAQAVTRHDHHHQLRNALHLVCSLLNLQRATVPDAAARAVLDDAVERISLLGSVYGALAREFVPGADQGAGQVVGSRRLLAALGDELASSQDIAGRVAVTVEAVDAPLTVTQAIPVGLIVRELVVNSLRHGFPRGRCGTVAIRLTRDGKHGWRLEITDDGVGLSGAQPIDGFAPGFGLQLVGLMVDQLGGRLRRAASAGTRQVVRFTDVDASPVRDRARRARPSRTPAP